MKTKSMNGCAQPLRIAETVWAAAAGNDGEGIRVSLRDLTLIGADGAVASKATHGATLSVGLRKQP